MQFNEILDPIADLLEQKNQNYGDSFTLLRSEFGKISTAIRLQDKVNRIKSIAKNENTELGDESYEDTLKDIIGYCTLELKYMNEQEDVRKRDLTSEESDLIEKMYKTLWSGESE